MYCKNITLGNLKPKKILFFLISFILPFLFIGVSANTSETKRLTEESFSGDEKIDENFYLLDSGDVINIYIPSLQDISGDYLVLQDGSINVPFAGRINVRNLSVEQSENLIMKRLQKEVIEPQVYITIAKPRPIRYTVIGEVQKPGLYFTSRQETSQEVNTTTIIDAIRKAGGITQNANLTKVKIIRKQPGDQDYKYAFVNLVDLILKGDFSQNPYLLDGDVIELSSGVKSSLTESNMNITSTNLSPQKFKISVIGMVNRPGVFEVDSSITLSQAILLAGGPVFQKASFSNVDLIRINRNGSANMSKYTVNLNKDYSDENNPILQNGDIVRINKNIGAKVAGTLKTIVEPVKEIIPAITFIKLVD